MHTQSATNKEREIPAVWMRGGTSKGIFFLASDLPHDTDQRDRLILATLGSPDPYGRQLDGLGGATSSTSKAVILSTSTRDDCDVDYLFAHVGIESGVIDYSGNCGNLSAAVGLFAIEQGLVPKGNGIVRVWQANLRQRFSVYIPVDSNGAPQTQGNYSIAGVPNQGPRIDLVYDDLLGGDHLGLPTGNPIDAVEVPSSGAKVSLTCMAVGNPMLLAPPEILDLRGDELPISINSDHELLKRAESIRCAGAVHMGVASSTDAALAQPATPKLALVSAPCRYETTAGTSVAASEIDLCVRTFSMGKLHHAIPATAAIALAVAVKTRGTVANRFDNAGCSRVRLGHPAGVTELDVHMRDDGTLDRVLVYRTARTLMRGHVRVPA